MSDAAGMLNMVRRSRASVVLPEELGPDKPIISVRLLSSFPCAIDLRADQLRARLGTRKSGGFFFLNGCNRKLKLAWVAERGLLAIRPSKEDVALNNLHNCPSEKTMFLRRKPSIGQSSKREEQMGERRRLGQIDDDLVIEHMVWPILFCVIHRFAHDMANKNGNTLIPTYGAAPFRQRKTYYLSS